LKWDATRLNFMKKTSRARLPIWINIFILRTI
jgi:hypothetical protein